MPLLSLQVSAIDITSEDSKSTGGSQEAEGEGQAAAAAPPGESPKKAESSPQKTEAPYREEERLVQVGNLKNSNLFK